MKILIVNYLEHKNKRGTVNEHLYAFSNYSNEECYYLNVAYGIPGYITKIGFDLIIYHSTFLNLRTQLVQEFGALKKLKGYKVAMPQDEYQCSESLNEFFRDFEVKTILTICKQPQGQIIFPKEKSGLEHYLTVFTGYIDDTTLGKLAEFSQSHKSRPIDIGYRANRYPYSLGRQAVLKWQLTEKFMDTPAEHSLKLDLSNDPRDIFWGDDWYRFLSNCRVVLGCEGGASLHDPDDSIRRKVDGYVYEHPEATFEEVEQACFPGLDGNFTYYALSPRHFEACMTRTCQALVEGEYGGIFKPGVHYIEIKKDWSNIPAVIRQIEDLDYCEQIAENAYRDIVESGLYTYRRFVHLILNHVREVGGIDSDTHTDDSHYLRLLEWREKYPYVFSPFAFLRIYIRDIIYRLLLRFNLYKDYKKLKWVFNKTTEKLRLL